MAETRSERFMGCVAAYAVETNLESSDAEDLRRFDAAGIVERKKPNFQNFIGTASADFQFCSICYRGHSLIRVQDFRNQRM